MMLKVLLFSAALFSGAAALIYETLWLRDFSLILGSTVKAGALTFSAFLAGLALGAYGVGKWSLCLRYPVRAYVLIELALGTSAFGFGQALRHNIEALADLFAILRNSPLEIFGSFILVFLVLCIPTFFMGGTFPLLLNAARNLDSEKNILGKIYAMNVFGAALGTLLTGFFLIRILGMSCSLGMGAAFNFISAFCCLPWLKLQKPADREDVKPEGEACESRFLLFLTALSGFCILGAEVIGVRLSSFFLGNRAYAFSILLSVVLILLSLGSKGAAGFLTKMEKRREEGLAWLLLFSALGIMASGNLISLWIFIQPRVEPALPGFENFILLYRFAETFLLLMPVFLPLGMLFPLTLMLSVKGREVGGIAGRFYLWNTVGSVAGSLYFGFYGVRFLGSLGSLYFLGACCLVVSLFIFRRAKTEMLKRRRGIVLFCAALTLLFPNPLRIEFASGMEKRIYLEDEYGIFQIFRLKNGNLRVYNNSTSLIFNLGSRTTSYVQSMQGHLGMLYSPGASSALVIGSGYGITAGVLGLYPGLESVDAVEILPQLINHAEMFEPYNYSYHENKKVRCIRDDGRHFLVKSRMKYDLISVNLTDPTLPGAAQLYHREFFDLVKEHLSEKGVLVQHIFTKKFPGILATLKKSFRYVRIYPAYKNSYNAVLSDHPLLIDEARIKALISEEKVFSSLKDIGCRKPENLIRFSKDFLLPESLVTNLSDIKEIATDDHPILEFAWDDSMRKILFSNE